MPTVLDIFLNSTDQVKGHTVFAGRLLNGNAEVRKPSSSFLLCSYTNKPISEYIILVYFKY